MIGNSVKRRVLKRINFMSDFKNKKVLLLGLGLHGGGAGTAAWLYRQGARLVVSDLRDARYDFTSK